MNRRATSPASRQAGFTVLELIVVFAIISLLATVTLVATNGYRERARTAATLDEVIAFQQAAAVHFSGANRYPVPTNPAEACTNDDHVAPNVCCISAGGCTYAGESLGSGRFAEGSFFGNIMPTAPQAPLAANAGGLDYRGIFYYCSSDSCIDATVVWTQTASACVRGSTHTGGNDGVCEQGVAGN